MGQQLREDLAQALARRFDLNPGLQQQGLHFYITRPDGTRVKLVNSMEGMKFAVACSCDEGHVRYCTLNSIRRSQDLLCQFCHHDSAAWEAAKKRKVVQSEKDCMQALRHQGLHKDIACEVALPILVWPC